MNAGIQGVQLHIQFFADYMYRNSWKYRSQFCYLQYAHQDLSCILNVIIINFQFNDGNGVRLRYDPLSSEMVEGKMVLKILKPPRNKDSLGSLTGQSLSWVFNVRTLLKYLFMLY